MHASLVVPFWGSVVVVLGLVAPWHVGLPQIRDQTDSLQCKVDSNYLGITWEILNINIYSFSMFFFFFFTGI